MDKYKQKYEDVIGWIKDIYPSLDEEMKKDAERRFKELVETEDEKMSREIIDFIQWEVLMGSLMPEHREKSDSWIAWLDMQNGKNYVPRFNIGDEIKLESEPKYPYRKIVAIKDNSYYFDDNVRLPFKHQDKWEVKQKDEPKLIEWSEEDEKLYNKVLDAIYYKDCDENGENSKDVLKEVGDWIGERAKSIKPQSHWKPSDAEMRTLQEAINNIRNGVRPYCSELVILEELYNDLKKL